MTSESNQHSESIKAQELSPETLTGIVDTLTRYYNVLSKDTTHGLNPELEKKARDERDEHMDQIATLQIMLEDFFDDPNSFEVRVQKVDRDDGSFGVKLKRQSDPPLSSENPQTQLSFHIQANRYVESIDEATHAAGIQTRNKGSDAALERRDAWGHHTNRITINTVHATVDPDTGRRTYRFQAGIQFKLADNALGISSSGIKFVGTHPHFSELITPQSVNPGNMQTFGNMIVTMAQQPRQTTQ